MTSSGLARWCRDKADGFRRDASRTTGQRSLKVSDLAAHYEAQAEGNAMAGNRPSIRQEPISEGGAPRRL
jgi:hypothetical protein